MNKFKEKRDSLENYVKEQIIGPGAYNKKYFFLHNCQIKLLIIFALFFLFKKQQVCQINFNMFYFVSCAIL